MIYFKIFYEFIKTGFFAVGGGLATIPFLYNISQKTNWYSLEELSNMIAISQSTPGPMGVNMATFTGYKIIGIKGAILAPVALIIPSIVVVLIVSHILTKFKDNKKVKDVFYGLRPASTALITAALIMVVKISLLNINKFETTKNIMDLFFIKGIILSIVMFYLIDKIKLHPILCIVASVFIGIIFKF